MKFVKLTGVGYPGIPEQPIWVNPHLVQSVNQRRVRQPSAGIVNAPAVYSVEGSNVTTGSGDEGTFSVVEDAEAVVGMLEAAAREPDEFVERKP